MDAVAMIDHLCRVQHDAYEAAAVREGWKTQESSRKPWDEVPEENKATMRASMVAVLQELRLCPDPTRHEPPTVGPRLTAPSPDMSQP